MRLLKLREDTIQSVHGVARKLIDTDLQTKHLPYSIAERKAFSVKMVLEQMPLYIGDQELIVGARTLYGKTPETCEDSNSDYSYYAMPTYINEADKAYFGFNHEYITKSHYTPDYGIVLKAGIDGLMAQLDEAEKAYTIGDQHEYANSVRIVYAGLKSFILRYATFAKAEAAKAEGVRKAELEEIAVICTNIASKPAQNLREACQLFWFLYMATIIENFQFVNFGRVDQVLVPYLGDESEDELTELMGCLLLKMYDQYDLILADKNLMGRYSAQHNITIGGVTRAGEDGSNPITKAVLRALSYTRLPEPLISVRISKLSPDWLMELASNLSITGLNCMAYYHDEAVIDSLHTAGLAIEDARDYGFGLCQDILIPGRGDHYCSAGVNLSHVLLKTLKENKDKELSFDQFYQQYLEDIKSTVDHNLTTYNLWEESIIAYNQGNRDLFFQRYHDGLINPTEPSPGISDAQAAKGEDDLVEELYIQTLMSPLPMTSSLYHGCMESGTDVTRCGCVNKDKGVMILGPVVAINSLVALKKNVFEEKRYTLAQIWTALEANWAGYEEMRQVMWNSPKWCNDDDYVDVHAVEMIATASLQINKYKTPSGGVHLAGVHQPHPVFAGRTLMATPEGRFAGTPIPVTLSPENGTLKNGPTAGFKSAAKIDHQRLQWNSCVMLQYYSSTFAGEDGAKKFANLLKAYHRLGGIQHQPNIVDIASLKEAQVTPEKYKDLIIRMWGVSAHFVDLPRDVQDEFISRYDF